jgi:hypothetical protein
MGEDQLQSTVVIDHMRDQFFIVYNNNSPILSTGYVYTLLYSIIAVYFSC